MSMPKTIGLFLGPLFFVLVHLVFPDDALDRNALCVLAVACWMVTWWITEAVPIPVTSLLPILLFPMLGILDIKESTASYAHPIIFLFLGGFLIALALEKRNLHKRFALSLIKITGTKPNGIILGFMLATAFLSMWISNTATTVMMLPIALSVIQLTSNRSESISITKKGLNKFSISLLLGIAYAANIGGMATIIGTPPNVVLVGFYDTLYGGQISFTQWMAFGLPIATILLFVCYYILVHWIYPNKVKNFDGIQTEIHEQLIDLGKFSSTEKKVAVVFILTAIGWIIRQPLNNMLGSPVLNDTIIALMGGILMFLVPVDLKNQEFILSWKDTRSLPWGILLLFGGGLTLASAMESVGIIKLIVNQFEAMEIKDHLFLLIGLTFVMLFMTELMSNVAITTIFLPVVMALAVSLNLSPLYFAITVTLASSCAFMMPISTPPNAVVFSSGHIHMNHMLKAGIFLNIIAATVIIICFYLMRSIII
ncbi:MAG: SLC13/DASS family transporter [Bacteroidia bacterium]|nr:SLC13 family permease [Bacteroidia bacterium]NNC85412.1 SLC13/DASS family transporter [Bacteroidia bacterium]NNM16136.1 SLC13/DASS family transporter [Bacteroidia bacterium]